MFNLSYLYSIQEGQGGMNNNGPPPYIPLRATIVVLNRFYGLFNMFKSQVLGTRCVFKHYYSKMFGLQLNKYEQFSPTWSCGSR